MPIIDTVVPRQKPGIVSQQDIAFASYENTTAALADPAFEWDDLDETAGMFSDQGRLFELNLVAAFVWDLIDGQRSIRQIKNNVVSQFDVDKAEAEADVEEVMEALTGFGLVLLDNA